MFGAWPESQGELESCDFGRAKALKRGIHEGLIRKHQISGRR